ncbi:MAG: glycosyltransferase [Phycisphaeraceae bacterium]
MTDALPDRPIRVLHSVHHLVRGGIETWLTQVLRRIDRQAVAIDVMVNVDTPSDYDAEAKALGARVLPCLSPARPWRYASHFRRLVREHGPYDVVHCHTGPWCGFVMRLAAGADIPVRIAHSRNDQRSPRPLPAWQRAYRWQMRRWLRRHATHRLAVSRIAGETLFGADWLQQPGAGLFRSAIDLGPFRTPIDRAAVRPELAIPADAVVIGHVGRFAEQKNHPLLLEIFRHCLAREPRARLMLVGDGPRRNDVAAQVVAMGLSDHVTMLPPRDDVPRLMRGAMDVFALPSLHEGLPRVGLEAQAAGLPAVVADTVTEELAVAPGLVQFMPLADGPAAWAQRLLACVAAKRGDAQARALGVMAESEFNIDRNARALVELYASACQGIVSPATGLHT